MLPQDEPEQKESERKKMQLPRLVESVLRQMLELPEMPDDPQQALNRLQHLRRALAPEHELLLILSWLGRCRLAHRLAQEQLPLHSTEAYRVPDIVANFDYAGRELPALIEVKTTSSTGGTWRPDAKLSIKPHLVRYAELLNLPLLVAWRNGACGLFLTQRGRNSPRRTIE